MTPCLNPGSRLSRCLDSVAEQTYPRIEHIVIDGGSTDGTLDLLRSRAGIRWISEADGGQSDAINKGFRAASGEILGWLNADDELCPETIESVVRTMAERSAAWAYGHFVIWTDRREWLERAPRRLALQDFHAKNPVPQPGSFWTRSALDSVGLLDPSLHFGMDLDLWLRFLRHGVPYARVPRVLARFELHESSKSGSESLAAFIVDHARARAKNGLGDPAAASLGRAAALAATIDGEFHAGVFERELAEARASIGSGTLGPIELSRAAGAAEVAIIKLRAGRLPSARLILTAAPWKHAEVRIRLADAMRRAGSLLLRPLRGMRSAFRGIVRPHSGRSRGVAR